MSRHYRSIDQPVTVYAMLERVVSLYHGRLIVPQCHWSGNELSTSYGDWDEVRDHDEINPEKTYLIPGYCGGSDYSGDLVNVANHKALVSMFPDDWEDGTEYLDYSGGHGTFDIAIRLDVLTEEIMETIEGLEDYPLIDESLHSELEMESQNEAWSNGLRSDFKKALGRALWDVYESSDAGQTLRPDETEETYQQRLDAIEEYLSEECGEMTDDDLDSLFYPMADLANVYWSNESGSDSWIDVDDVVTGGLEVSQREDSFGDYKRTALAKIQAQIRNAMSDRKFDLGIVRYVCPDQLRLPFQPTEETTTRL
jgi:hypothetical protein